MKRQFTTAIFKDDMIILENGQKNPLINISELSERQKIQLNGYIELCNEISVDSNDIIPIPEDESVYIMQKPCPVNSDLTVKIYDRNYKNDKELKVIQIDIIAIHFDSQGNRVPLYDRKDVVIADMSEERRVEITEGVYEYSYVLANAIIENGEPVKTLIAKAIQIADADGSLNQRLYGLN